MDFLKKNYRTKTNLIIANLIDKIRMAHIPMKLKVCMSVTCPPSPCIMPHNAHAMTNGAAMVS